jgi:hypothetical protein
VDGGWYTTLGARPDLAIINASHKYIHYGNVRTHHLISVLSASVDGALAGSGRGCDVTGRLLCGLGICTVAEPRKKAPDRVVRGFLRCLVQSRQICAARLRRITTAAPSAARAAMPAPPAIAGSTIGASAILTAVLSDV